MPEWYPAGEGPTVPRHVGPGRPGPARGGAPRPMPGPPPPLPPTGKLPIVPSEPEPEVVARPVPPLPVTVAVVGGVWWVLGAAALDTGVGTVIGALGLGVTAWLVLTLRRTVVGARLSRPGRTRLLKVVGIAAAVGIGAEIGLGALGFGELAVPLACGVLGLGLFGAARVLGERIWIALGGALLVLAAAGAVLALGSASQAYPQGLVGIVAGVAFWLAAAQRTGLLDDLWARVRR